MNKSIVFGTLLLFLIISAASLYMYTSARFTPPAVDISVRRSFASLTGLPGTAVYSENGYERHRNLSAPADILSKGPFSIDTGLASAVYTGAR